MSTHYTYEATLEASRKSSWEIEDIIGGGKSLDFRRPFMPESLARVGELGFLSPAEQLTLNHIRGNEYLRIFGLVEEFSDARMLADRVRDRGTGRPLRR